MHYYCIIAQTLCILQVHPNQLSRDFKPSLRLPDNFVHQLGNMIIDPNSGEVFKSSASNEQKIPAMKKMIFPHSSEENDFSIEDMMNAFRQGLLYFWTVTLFFIINQTVFSLNFFAFVDS